MKQFVYLFVACGLILSDRFHTCCYGSPLSEKDEFRTTRFKEGLGVMTLTNIQHNGSDYFTADVNAKFNVPIKGFQFTLRPPSKEYGLVRIDSMSKEVGLAADWGLTDIISGKESQSLMAYSSQGNKIPRNVNSEKSVKTAQVKPAMLTTIRFQWEIPEDSTYKHNISDLCLDGVVFATMEGKVSRTLYIYDADPACPELDSVVNKLRLVNEKKEAKKNEEEEETREEEEAQEKEETQEEEENTKPERDELR